MKSSLILGSALFLALAATSVVQARKDPCKDGIGGEVVVKAAKVQKPLFYASPDAINRAAAAREGIGRLSVSTGGGCNGAYSISGTSASTSASTSISSSSSSSSSSLSSIGGLLDDEASANTYSPFSITSSKLTSSCGCNKKGGSLELSDLLSLGAPGQVVPSFPPIGDLCYPNGPNHPNSKYLVTAKVTPAYPGKLRVNSLPSKSQEVCVNLVNGQVDQAGLQKLGLSTFSDSSSAKLGLYGGSRLGSLSTSSGVNSVFGRSESQLRGNTNIGSLGAVSSSRTRGYAGSQAISGAGSLISSQANSFTGYGNSAGSLISSQASGSTGYGNSAGSLISSQASASTGYGNSLATSGSELFRESAGSFGYNDFDDELELPQDHSYPGVPADPVSVTLAYKNIFPLVLYNKRTKFVPEDKLAFGHRTVPTESVPSSKQAPNVPEEKLQVVDKPVVELRPVSVNPVTVGVYSEYEEAKLAELEAIERERIRQEELSQQTRANYITYGDLGYEPINRVLSSQVVNTPTTWEDEIEVGCGPVGPAVAGFVPGSVVINQEVVQTEDELEDSQNAETNAQRYQATSVEDDDDDSSSGIFARLKNLSRKSALCTSF